MTEPRMSRRRYLRLASAGSAIGIAGCGSSLPGPLGETPTPTARERCGGYRFPERHMGVLAFEETASPGDVATIRSDDLSPAERSVVERAVERGRYRVCLPEATEREADGFAAFADRVADHAVSASGDGYVAYLEYEGTWYRITHARKGDVVVATAG